MSPDFVPDCSSTHTLERIGVFNPTEGLKREEDPQEEVRNLQSETAGT